MDVMQTIQITRGAVKAIAEDLGISLAAVSKWKRCGIPPARLPAVKIVLERHIAAGVAAAADARREAA
jgi:hypothetical protein